MVDWTVAVACVAKYCPRRSPATSGLCSRKPSSLAPQPQTGMSRPGSDVDPPRRVHTEDRGVVLERQADLPEIVHALRPPRRFPGRLHGGQEQRDQKADDQDDDEQFDQRECPAGSRRVEFSH